MTVHLDKKLPRLTAKTLQKFWQVAYAKNSGFDTDAMIK